MKANKFLLIFMLGILPKINAQQTKVLTLPEVISLSKENSKLLKLSKTQIENAKFQIEQAKNQRLPDLNITGQGLHLFDTSKIKLDMPVSAGSGTAAPIPDYALVGQAALSVPLFAGFKITNGIAVAKYNQQLQEANYSVQEDDVEIQAIDVFVKLYKTKQSQKVVEANLEQAKQNTRDFQNLEQNGMVARNDLLRVQLQESNIELALMETKKNFNVINYNLNLLLGLPENTVIDPQLDFDYHTGAISEDDYLSKASDNRKEYQVLDLQDKIAKKNVDIVKGDYYPQIALSGGYMYIDVNHLGSLQNATNTGLGVKYNLASLFKNRSAVASAKNQVQQVQDNLSILDDQVKSQIHTAYQEYNYSIDQTHVYDKALVQANENYRIVKNKHDNGLANTDDLLTANLEQLQAALNQANGKAEVLLTYYKLLRQAGLISLQ